MRHERSADIIGPWNRMVINERRRGKDLAGSPAHAIRARDDVLQVERCSTHPAYAQAERQQIAEPRRPGEIAGQMYRGCSDLPDRDQSRPWKPDRRPELFDDTIEDVQIGREVRDA